MLKSEILFMLYEQRWWLVFVQRNLFLQAALFEWLWPRNESQGHFTGLSSLFLNTLNTPLILYLSFEFDHILHRDHFEKKKKKFILDQIYYCKNKEFSKCLVTILWSDIFDSRLLCCNIYSSTKNPQCSTLNN